MYEERDLLVLTVTVAAVFVSDTGGSCHCLSVPRTNLGLRQSKHTKYSGKREIEKTRLAQIRLVNRSVAEQGIKLKQLLRQIHVFLLVSPPVNMYVCSQPKGRFEAAVVPYLVQHYET